MATIAAMVLMRPGTCSDVSPELAECTAPGRMLPASAKFASVMSGRPPGEADLCAQDRRGRSSYAGPRKRPGEGLTSAGTPCIGVGGPLPGPRWGALLLADLSRRLWPNTLARLPDPGSQALECNSVRGTSLVPLPSQKMPASRWRLPYLLVSCAASPGPSACVLLPA